MSTYKRVQQWATFAKTWHLYDAKWQNPFDSASVIAKYLRGLNKPIFHPLSHCGDHVVVINCKHIALPGDEWKRRVYFHHTGRPGGDTWTLAWELHKKNACMIMQKAVYAVLPKNLSRPQMMQCLHLFEEEAVPDHMLSNISSQIPQLRRIPRKLSSYSEKEIEEYPKIQDFSKDYIINFK